MCRCLLERLGNSVDGTGGEETTESSEGEKGAGFWSSIDCSGCNLILSDSVLCS